MMFRRQELGAAARLMHRARAWNRCTERRGEAGVPRERPASGGAAREELRREHLERLFVARIQAAGRRWRRRTLHVAERSEDSQKTVAGGICAREDMG